MSRVLTSLASLAVVAPALAALGFAQTSEAPPLSDQDRIAELERRIALLADEVEAAKLGSVRPPLGDGAYGLAPAAARVYDTTEGVSIGGYGEMRFDGVQGGSDVADFHRAVLYVGHRFDEKWLLNTEFEFEHASVEDTNDGSGDTAPGSVSVEFAYVEYQHTPGLGVRAGLVLLPVGIANELHEPNTFLSANRPFVEQRIIPTTWRENGVGVFGDVGEFTYRAYVVNGLDAQEFSSNGIRNGRQKGGLAKADDLAAVARLDWVGRPGLTVGGSMYYGRSGQDLSIGVDTLLAEGHVDWRANGWHVRALYALLELDDVAELNGSLGLTGTGSVGESQDGWYAEVGYDVLHGRSEQSLTPFVRVEALDTQSDVPAGFASNPARDREYLTFGFAWSPIEQFVVKADYVDGDNGNDSESDLFRLGIGYVF
jgi:hypothetical protein